MRKQNWGITELAVLSLVAKWITVRVTHTAFLWKTRKCKQHLAAEETQGSQSRTLKRFSGAVVLYPEMRDFKGIFFPLIKGNLPRKKKIPHSYPTILFLVRKRNEEYTRTI